MLFWEAAACLLGSQQLFCIADKLPLAKFCQTFVWRLLGLRLRQRPPIVSPLVLLRLVFVMDELAGGR